MNHRNRGIISYIFGILALTTNFIVTVKFSESRIQDQFISFRQKRLKASISYELPGISALLCDLKEAPLKHSNINNAPLIRLCKAENICWNSKEKRLEISRYIKSGSEFPNPSELYYTNLNGMRENLAFVWFPLTFPEPRPENLKIAWIDEPTLLMKRYLAVNTMHLLHDEILPGLATILHHSRLRESNENRLIVTLDEYGENPNDEMLRWLGQFWRMDSLQALIRYENGFKSNEYLDYVCFKEGFIGIDSPSTSWYQYGYETPQGPMKGTDEVLVGSNVRSAVEWIKREVLGAGNYLSENQDNEDFKIILQKNETETGAESSIQDEVTAKPIISIVSRTITRLILNENELKSALEIAFPSAEVLFLRQETMDMPELIDYFSNSAVVIGMHGALLSLSAFMPRGALLIELFPFGIPAHNYTPYKTLANLPGMDIKYRSWVNPKEDYPFTIGHPEKHYTLGGISHYPDSYQEGIRSTKTVPSHKCCYSPFWLYRIFQDTQVDSKEIIEIIKNELENDFKNKI